MLRVRTILYPTDFSSYSNQAYLHAVSIAERHGAGLTVVYVTSPEQSEDKDYWRGQLEQIRPANPNINFGHRFLEGDPATEIVRYAVEASFDLIVMGTHGRTGLTKLLIGSVASRVIATARCPVVTVRGQ